MPKAWGFCYVQNTKVKKTLLLNCTLKVGHPTNRGSFFMSSLKTKYNMRIMIG